MFSCCGVWWFGRPRRYMKLDELESLEDSCPPAWRAEIDLGLPPGVNVGDLIQNTENTAAIKQAYLLAVQSNRITDYLKRFDAINIPNSCKAVVEAQVTKLKAVRTVIWNTLIAMSVGEISIEEEGLQALLEKQAGESLALMEVEKIAHAIKMDDTSLWALNIASVIESTKGVIPGLDDAGLDALPTLTENVTTSQPQSTIEHLAFKNADEQQAQQNALPSPKPTQEPVMAQKTQ